MRNHECEKLPKPTALMFKILEAKVENPELKPYQIAKKLGLDKAAVGHSWNNMLNQRPYYPRLRKFIDLWLEAEKKGVFKEEVYVRKVSLGRPPLALKYDENGDLVADPENITGQERVKAIFEDLRKGMSPAKVAAKYKMSTRTVERIRCDDRYMKLGIVDKEAFYAVQPGPDKAPYPPKKKFALSWVDGRLEPDEEAETYKSMVEKRKDPKEPKTYEQIASDLEDLTESQVKKILSDPIYAGYRFVDGELKQVPWVTPIISLEEWKELQDIDLTPRWIRKQKEDAKKRRKKVKNCLPASKEEIQKITGLSPRTFEVYLRQMKKDNEVVKLFDGKYYRTGPWTNAILQFIEQKGWRCFMANKGLKQRDKILRCLMKNEARYFELLRHTKLSDGGLRYWLEVLQKDGIVKKRKGRRGKFYLSQGVAMDLRTLYKLLESVRNRKKL